MLWALIGTSVGPIYIVHVPLTKTVVHAVVECLEIKC